MLFDSIENLTLPLSIITTPRRLPSGARAPQSFTPLTSFLLAS
jgi:hypothetical protein